MSASVFCHDRRAGLKLKNFYLVKGVRFDISSSEPGISDFILFAEKNQNIEFIRYVPKLSLFIIDLLSNFTGATCTDNKKYLSSCPGWARQGECKKKWMWANCCKSCQAPCKDDAKHQEDCPDWAKSGECNKNKNWMWNHCCKSCRTWGKTKLIRLLFSTADKMYRLLFTFVSRATEK